MNKRFNKEASRLRRKAGEISLYTFAKLYLSQHLLFEPSEAHMELYALAQEMLLERGKKIAIAAPREFGKTTMFTNILLPYCVCFAKEHFIIIISHTKTQAIKILENLKKELTQNEKLSDDFPEIFENDGTPKPPRWNEQCIITRNNICVKTSGFGQPIRGMKHESYRPGLVILDDLEPGEASCTLEGKNKIKDWLNKSLLRIGTHDTNYLFLGNVFHSFSLLGELIKSPNEFGWKTRCYQAICDWPKNMDLWAQCWRIYSNQESCTGMSNLFGAEKFYNDNKEAMDEGAHLLWPKRWSLFDLMMQYYRDEVSFMSEMQNEPKDLSEFALDVDKFHYWDERYACADDICQERGIEFFAACDPSLGESSLKGDYSSIAIIAKKGSFYYIIESDTAHKKTERLIDDIIAYSGRYNFNQFGIEANGYQILLVKQLNDKAAAAGIRTEFVPIKNMKDKIMRVHTLSPWITNGYIQFSRRHTMLLNESRQFPNCKHDDALDALEMAIRMASEGRGGKLDIHAKDKKDIVSPYFEGWDPADREFLEFRDDDDDGPSPNSREIEFL